MVVDSGAYFRGGAPRQDSLQICEEIVIRFRMPDPNRRYHIPIIMSPNSYSCWWSSRTWSLPGRRTRYGANRFEHVPPDPAHPYTGRAEAHGVRGYSVVNHMLLPKAYGTTVEEDYWHLREHVQIWDVGCQRQVQVGGPDAAELVQLMTRAHLRTIRRARGCISR
ncbi:MAG: hypothetical protein CM15mP115_01950 [Alphaproteobacteria bacterium]|nr:MAG: hypothetical protein CM15mP115_01950 [Alphaproteobacteria bacterium]